MKNLFKTIFGIISGLLVISLCGVILTSDSSLYLDDFNLPTKQIENQNAQITNLSQNTDIVLAEKLTTKVITDEVDNESDTDTMMYLIDEEKRLKELEISKAYSDDIMYIINVMQDTGETSLKDLGYVAIKKDGSIDYNSWMYDSYAMISIGNFSYFFKSTINTHGTPIEIINIANIDAFEEIYELEKQLNELFFFPIESIIQKEGSYYLLGKLHFDFLTSTNMIVSMENIETSTNDFYTLSQEGFQFIEKFGDVEKEFVESELSNITNISFDNEITEVKLSLRDISIDYADKIREKISNIPNSTIIIPKED